MAAKPKSAASKASFDYAELVTLFPERLGEWTLTKLGPPLPSPYQPLAPALLAEYERGAQRVELDLSTWMPTPAAGSAPVIRHSRDDGQNMNHASLMLQNGLSIGASSRSADADALGKLINSMDLSRAAKLVKTKRK